MVHGSDHDGDDRDAELTHLLAEIVSCSGESLSRFDLRFWEMSK